MNRVILCDTKDAAFTITERMYDDECKRKGNTSSKAERTTRYLLAVQENILSGQFGLHCPPAYWDAINDDCKVNAQLWNPLWIGQEFLNGAPFFVIGNTPFGFGAGVIEPTKVRGILEGNYSKDLISQVRKSGRNYTTEVHNLAKRAILDMQADKSFQRRLLSSIDAYRFEELVAELLRHQGFDVFLTRRSGDEGRDIIAVFYEDGREHLMMIECKRRKDGTILGPVEARALLGQFYVEKLKGTGFTCAMLVTSASGFGPSAIKIEEQCYELALKGRDQIADWISAYGQFHDGLWVPKRFKELF